MTGAGSCFLSFIPHNSLSVFLLNFFDMGVIIKASSSDAPPLLMGLMELLI
jgi:hypothetical protein